MKKIDLQVGSVIERKHSLILIVVILSVVVSGIFYSLYLGNKLRYADEKEYYVLAANIAQHHKYSFDNEHPTAYRPPGYPLILSAFMLFGAQVFYLRMINFIFLGLSIYYLYKIIEEHSCISAGLLGAILVVFYPVLFYTAGALYPQTAGSCLFLIILYLLTKKQKSYPLFILSGVLFGLLMLIIPNFIICLFIIGIWFWFFEDSSQSRRIIVTIVVSFLPVSIWCVRNCMVFKSFVFVSANSGFMLLLGNCENTTPNAGPNVDISKYKAEAVQMKLNSIEEDAYYRSMAVEWIVNNKTRALNLFCLKLLNYFNYKNDLATKSEASFAKDIFMLTTYGPLLLLFIIRVLLMVRFKPSRFESLFIVLYLSSALSYAVFFTRIRYRLPFDFLLIAVVAVFLHNFFFAKIFKHGDEIQ